MPLISVIIPSRNRPAMLREAVESVVAQTHKDLEIIVVLTGADEPTTKMARDLEREYGARILETAPFNLAATRNNGMEIASGEWLSFLDDDDLWVPTKLEKQLAVARSAAADLVTTNWVRFDRAGNLQTWMPKGSPLPNGLSYRQALMLNNYVSVGSLVRANVLRSLNGFDAGLPACEDWDMWRRISHEHRIAYVDEVLMRVRIHDQNMSSKRWVMYSTSFRHLLKMHHDTPSDLRHMLRPARRSNIWSLASVCYETANDRTGSIPRKLVRWLRSHATASAAR